MAETTLLYTIKRSQIDSIELDASISEMHTGNVEVTEHPVESGFNVADHARPQAETLQIEGFISNTPIPFGGEAAVHTGTYTDASGRVFEWQSKSNGYADRAAIAYSALRDLKDLGAIITVVTALRTYEDMIITALSVPRDASTGNGLRFSATLKQIRVVNAQTVAPTAGEDKTKKKKVLDKKATETAPTPPKSALDQLGEAAGVFRGM